MDPEFEQLFIRGVAIVLFLIAGNSMLTLRWLWKELRGNRNDRMPGNPHNSLGAINERFAAHSQDLTRLEKTIADHIRWAVERDRQNAKETARLGERLARLENRRDKT